MFVSVYSELSTRSILDTTDSLATIMWYTHCIFFFVGSDINGARIQLALSSCCLLSSSVHHSTTTRVNCRRGGLHLCLSFEFTNSGCKIFLQLMSGVVLCFWTSLLSAAVLVDCCCCCLIAVWLKLWICREPNHWGILCDGRERGMEEGDRRKEVKEKEEEKERFWRILMDVVYAPLPTPHFQSGGGGRAQAPLPPISPPLINNSSTDTDTLKHTPAQSCKKIVVKLYLWQTVHVWSGIYLYLFYVVLFWGDVYTHLLESHIFFPLTTVIEASKCSSGLLVLQPCPNNGADLRFPMLPWCSSGWELTPQIVNFWL